MKYQSTKTYGHERGLSCCFRQHKANSHCNLLHGYALSFKFVFEANNLDNRGWVVDFGGLKILEERLRFLFDHTLVIAQDDPYLQEIEAMQLIAVADVHVVDRVGCESFAEIAYNMANQALQELWAKEYTKSGYKAHQRVRVVSCECAEHGANSAIYYGDN